MSAIESQKISELIGKVSADQQKAMVAQLQNALAKGAIRTSPSGWLKAVIHRTGSHTDSKGAPRLSVADYVERLIQGGISAEDAQHIAEQTFNRRVFSSLRQRN